MNSEKPINFTREAFFHPVNLGILLMAILVASMVGGDYANIIISTTFGAELLYLGIIPRSLSYQKSVKMRKMRERHSVFGEQELFERLDQTGQKRFLIMKHLSGLIKENFDSMAYVTQGLLENIHAKIKGLLANYIINLEMLQRYHRYLTTTSSDKLKKDIASLRADVNQTDSDKLKEIKGRRLNILHKRLDKIDKAKEKFSICESQLETIEDTIRYIYEKSMTMTNPEEIGSQLDNLIYDLEETAAMMEDLNDDMPLTFSPIQEIDIPEVPKEKSKKSGRISG